MRGKLGDKQRLQHILKAILELEAFTDGVTYPEFCINRMMQQACVSNFGIIGEATNHLSSELKSKYDTIDWSGVKSFRNVIVHEYFKIDIQVVWQVIQDNLPELKWKIQKIITDLSE